MRHPSAVLTAIGSAQQARHGLPTSPQENPGVTMLATAGNLVWFGIFIVLSIETAQVGCTRVVPPGRSAAMMAVMVLLMYFFPGITSWLPEHMAG